jgi:hypothetical protein
MTTKGKALTPLKLQYIDGRTWSVIGTFCWQFRDGYRLCVTDGFIFDFNSIPFGLRNTLPPTKHGQAAVIHDWCYAYLGEVMLANDQGAVEHIKWTRKECDERYLEILEDLKAAPWRRNIMYLGVRIGGWVAWLKHKSLTKFYGRPKSNET